MERHSYRVAGSDYLQVFKRKPTTCLPNVLAIKSKEEMSGEHQIRSHHLISRLILCFLVDFIPVRHMPQIHLKI